MFFSLSVRLSVLIALQIRNCYKCQRVAISLNVTCQNFTGRIRFFKTRIKSTWYYYYYYYAFPTSVCPNCVTNWSFILCIDMNFIFFPLNPVLTIVLQTKWNIYVVVRDFHITLNVFSGLSPFCFSIWRTPCKTNYDLCTILDISIRSCSILPREIVFKGHARLV